MTAVHDAARSGDTGRLAALLADGADPDPVDSSGESPLYVAAARGLTEVVARLLAEPGVDPNRRSERGWGPLTAAAFAGHAPVVRLLLTHPQLRAAARDAQGRTAFWWAATGGRAEAARLLAEHGAGVQLTDDDGVDAAGAAAAAGHAELAAELHQLVAAAEPAQGGDPQFGEAGEDRYHPPDEPPPGRVIREPSWRLREGR
jgi:ankyrin repeat protein